MDFLSICNHITVYYVLAVSKQIMNTEDQLLTDIEAGNTQAFSKLVEKYQDQMYSVCLSILKTKDEAQEATQDTFIKIYRSLDKYNRQSKFSSWAYRIAYRTSLDYIRKRKATIDIDKVDHTILSHVESSDNQVEQNELSDRLLQAISMLPAEEAGLVRMFYLEEQSIQELMDITGLSKSNTKVKLFRARKKLADIIRTNFSEMESYLEMQ